MAENLLAVGSVATAKVSAARFYVERMTCTIDTNGVTSALEPSESTDLSAILVTKYG